MKLSAFILILFTGFLILLPLISPVLFPKISNTVANHQSSGQSTPGQDDENDDCYPACNAFEACCFVAEINHLGFTFSSFCLTPRRAAATNENSLSNYESSCWQPPERIID